MSIVKINNKLPKLNGKFFDVTNEPGPGPTPSLPPYTLRLKYREGVTPTIDYGTVVQVSSSPNIWDLTYENNDWSSLLEYDSNLLEVIDGNTSGVTNMQSMFNGCDHLTSVALFDTSKVTNMEYMFYYCEYLTSVPLFDTSKVTNMEYMFYNCNSLTSVPLFDTSKVTNMEYTFGICSNVQSGALALYQQASTQANPPNNHIATFSVCGASTQTGAAELAQIPSDWK